VPDGGRGWSGPAVFDAAAARTIGTAQRPGSDCGIAWVRAGEPRGRKRAFAAMMTMKKFDIAAVERAYTGTAVTA
jgi:hypothetical protein